MAPAPLHGQGAPEIGGGAAGDADAVAALFTPEFAAAGGDLARASRLREYAGRTIDFWTGCPVWPRPV